LGLRILYGEHTGDLLDACLEEICSEAILWPQKRAFLIVPEQTKADTERSYLEVRQRMDAKKPHPAGSDGNALMLIDVVSFQRFAHRILSETGGFPEGFLDDASKTMIIHQIHLQFTRQRLSRFHQQIKTLSRFFHPRHIQHQGDSCRRKMRQGMCLKRLSVLIDKGNHTMTLRIKHMKHAIRF